MSVAELLTSVQYIVDGAGHKKAVQIDLNTWDQIVALLQEAEKQQLEHPSAEFEAWDGLSDEALVD